MNSVVRYALRNRDEFGVHTHAPDILIEHAHRTIGRGQDAGLALKYLRNKICVAMHLMHANPADGRHNPRASTNERVDAC